MKETLEEARANSFIEFAKVNTEVDMYSFVAGFNKGVKWEDVTKQETLEEAAISNYRKLYEGEPLTQEVPIDAFKRGYRLAQKQMYSVEEMFKLTDEYEYCILKTNQKYIPFKEWFEKVRKE